MEQLVTNFCLIVFGSLCFIVYISLKTFAHSPSDNVINEITERINKLEKTLQIHEMILSRQNISRDESYEKIIARLDTINLIVNDKQTSETKQTIVETSSTPIPEINRTTRTATNSPSHIIKVLMKRK